LSLRELRDRCADAKAVETEPLCDLDHDLKTYKGWALVEGKGKRLMVPPDDPRHPRHGRPPP